MARRGTSKYARRKAASAATSDWSLIRSTFARLDVYDRIAWGCLLAIAFLIPLAMSNFTWLGFTSSFTNDQFDLPKLVILRGLSLIALGAWGWGMAARGGELRTHKVFYLVAFFLVWSLIASVTSIHVPTAFLGKYKRFDGWISYLNYAVLLFLVLQYSQRFSRVRALTVTFTISMGIAALYGVSQSLGVDAINWGSIPFEANRAFSTFGNPDMLGGALAFSAPVALGLALSTERLVDRTIYWIVFLLMMWACIVSFVRGAWIGVFIGLVILIIAIIVQRARLRSVDFGFVGATLAAVAAAIVRSLSVDHEVMNFARRFASLLDVSSGSGLTRTQIWQAATAAIADRPLFGFGPDTFRLIFPKYKPVEYVAAAGYRSVADNAHNYPLQVATGVGIPGVLALYGIFAWIAVISAKHVFKRNEATGANLVFAGLWAGCAAYIAHLFVGLSLVGATTFFWIALALLLSPATSVRRIEPPAASRVIVVALAAAVAAGLVGNTLFTVADNRHLASSFAMGRGDAVAAEQASASAIALNPFNEVYRSQPGLAWMEDGSRKAQAGDVEGALASYAHAVTFILDARDYCPPEYDNHVFLSGAYNIIASISGQNSYHEKSLEAADEAIALEEYGPGARVQKAVALRGLGRIDEAREELEYAIEMDPNYAQAREILAQIDADSTGEGSQ